jgi:CheY-like chemotaxis protein
MKKKILLVEDNPAAAVMMQIQIEFLGYDVEVAKDGLQAIKMTSLMRPDLIVLDIGMPPSGWLRHGQAHSSNTRIGGCADSSGDSVCAASSA